MESTERARRSLKDLAKLPDAPERPRAVATPDSSGFVDLAALTAASPSLVDAIVARAKSRSAVDIRELAVAEDPPEEAESPSVGTSTTKKRGGRTVLVALLALAAVGAAGFGAVRLKHRLVSPAPAPIVVSAPPMAGDAVPVVSTPVVTTSALQPAATAPQAEHAEQTAPTDTATTDTAAAPKDAKPDPKRGARGRPAATHAHGAPKLAAAIAAQRTAPATAAPAPAANSFTDAIKQASGASLPDRPSAPVVMTALRSAQASARGCLSSGAAPMRAVVTFASSGSVSSVQASGPGASCVQTALGRAKVPAFAQPTYTAAVTIHPN